MPLATSNGLSQSKSLFEGDLSSADSESDSSHTAVASVVRSPSKKARGKKAKVVVQPSRPRRQEIVKSYAESDTDGEGVPPISAVKSGKRKRNSSLNGSPTKKPKLDLLQASRSRSFSSGQVQSHQARGIVASIPASWPETGNPSRPPLISRKRAFIRLRQDGQPAGSASTDVYWWPAKKVCSRSSILAVI